MEGIFGIKSVKSKRHLKNFNKIQKQYYTNYDITVLHGNGSLCKDTYSCMNKNPVLFLKHKNTLVQ
jgi:hypothetical protein